MLLWDCLAVVLVDSMLCISTELTIGSRGFLSHLHIFHQLHFYCSCHCSLFFAYASKIQQTKLSQSLMPSADAVGKDYNPMVLDKKKKNNNNHTHKSPFHSTSPLSLMFSAYYYNQPILNGTSGCCCYLRGLHPFGWVTLASSWPPITYYVSVRMASDRRHCPRSPLCFPAHQLLVSWQRHSSISGQGFH